MATLDVVGWSMWKLEQISVFLVVAKPFVAFLEKIWFKVLYTFLIKKKMFNLDLVVLIFLNVKNSFDLLSVVTKMKESLKFSRLVRDVFWTSIQRLFNVMNVRWTSKKVLCLLVSI